MSPESNHQLNQIQIPILPPAIATLPSVINNIAQVILLNYRNSNVSAALLNSLSENPDLNLAGLQNKTTRLPIKHGNELEKIANLPAEVEEYLKLRQEKQEAALKLENQQKKQVSELRALYQQVKDVVKESEKVKNKIFAREFEIKLLIAKIEYNQKCLKDFSDMNAIQRTNFKSVIDLAWELYSVYRIEILDEFEEKFELIEEIEKIRQDNPKYETPSEGDPNIWLAVQYLIENLKPSKTTPDSFKVGMGILFTKLEDLFNFCQRAEYMHTITLTFYEKKIGEERTALAKDQNLLEEQKIKLSEMKGSFLRMEKAFLESNNDKNF